MAEHTPGPWAAERCHNTPCWHIEAGAYPFGSTICEVDENPKEGTSEANARLIASAPTLLNDFQDLWKAAWSVVETESLRSDDLCHSRVDRFRLEDLRSKLMTRAMLDRLTEHPEILGTLEHRLRTNAIVD